jgi:hypothetical protein
MDRIKNFNEIKYLKVLTYDQSLFIHTVQDKKYKPLKDKV